MLKRIIKYFYTLYREVEKEENDAKKKIIKDPYAWNKNNNSTPTFPINDGMRVAVKQMNGGIVVSIVRSRNGTMPKDYNAENNRYIIAPDENSIEALTKIIKLEFFKR